MSRISYDCLRAILVVVVFMLSGCSGGEEAAPIADEGAALDEAAATDESVKADESALVDEGSAVDSCSENNGGCDSNATCAEGDDNTISCSCNEGFEGDGIACTDIDECAADNDCAQVCTNLIGSYECSCESGFSTEDEGLTCIDIEECQSENECGVNATCVEEEGSYSCACNEGFDGDGFSCADVDECSLEGGLAVECALNSECVNLEGGFECVCLAGYEDQVDDVKPAVFDPQLCVDYCQLAGNNCVAENTILWGDSDCITVCNAYSQLGAEGDATGDTVQCRLYHLGAPAFEEPGIHCAHGAPDGGGVCVGDPPVPEPVDPPTEELNCVNIDECTFVGGEAVCGSNATCTDVPGSFACTCDEGYEGDGQSCTDADQCADPSLNDCDPNANCTDLEGSFSCACKSGFLGDGNTCTDVDECEEVGAGVLCDLSAETCVNTDGSYTCQSLGTGLVCQTAGDASSGSLSLSGVFTGAPVMVNSCETADTNAVWFRYTATVSGLHTLSATHTSAVLSAGTEVAVYGSCNLDAELLFCGTTAGLNFEDDLVMDSGTTYYIMVHTGSTMPYISNPSVSVTSP